MVARLGACETRFLASVFPRRQWIRHPSEPPYLADLISFCCTTCHLMKGFPFQNVEKEQNGFTKLTAENRALKFTRHSKKCKSHILYWRNHGALKDLGMKTFLNLHMVSFLTWPNFINDNSFSYLNVYDS